MLVRELVDRALASGHRSRVLRALLGARVRPPVGLLRRYGLRIDERREDYIADARRHPVFELRPAGPAS